MMPGRIKRTRETTSRYQPIVDLLAASPGDEVVLTFKEISALIGGQDLPESAILTGGWWTESSRRHVALWRAIGWRARYDRDRLRVIFTRDA